MTKQIGARQKGDRMTSDELHRRAGATFAIGSLPHRDIDDAIEFSWRSTHIPTIPSLPRRSPAEAMVAQALVGIEGVSVGQYGGIGVDVSQLDVDHFITTDISSDAYATFAAFLESFDDHVAQKSDSKKPDTVKWQFVGPVTLGVALLRIGLDADVAFPLALQAVRSHVEALEAEVGRVCGDITQIIMFDEPSLAESWELEFPLSTEEVIDLISGALAVVAPGNVGGVHCCARTDWAVLLATGAQIISVPVPNIANDDEMNSMVAAAIRISDHMEHGGHIAWGAVRTDGPIGSSAERAWKNLMECMCALVRAGVDPVKLRTMSYITPACGLATHTEGVAESVLSTVRNVSRKVAEQATASRLTLGS
jgi:methionine synthase II (cobalamin-independent)